MSVEICRMLPQTKILLEQDIKVRRQSLADISAQGAEIWEDGDQWHSSTYRAQQQAKENAAGFLRQIEARSKNVLVLTRPTQTVTVEAGHMVKVKFLDDQEILAAGVAFTTVHIFYPDDVRYLAKLFDGITAILVSNESPIGSRLIGNRRGDTSSYLNNQKLQLLTTDDAIMVSSLFDIEI